MFYVGVILKFSALACEIPDRIAQGKRRYIYSKLGHQYTSFRHLYDNTVYNIFLAKEKGWGLLSVFPFKSPYFGYFD